MLGGTNMVCHKRFVIELILLRMQAVLDVCTAVSGQ